MEATDFCYWLQGFFELSEGKKLTPKQVEIIKDHLQLVFNKVTPDRSVSYELPTDSTAGRPICNTFTGNGKGKTTVYCSKNSTITETDKSSKVILSC